jgi:hypothetical protein
LRLRAATARVTIEFSSRVRGLALPLEVAEGRRAMGDKLERVFEYRTLYSKQRDLQIPLTPMEEAQLGRLKQQLPDRVPTVDERDAFTVLATPLQAHYVVAGRFGSGTLRNASGVGLAISTNEAPPGLGERLILHVLESHHGVEYTFPCRVVARVVKGTPSMGVFFEGVPSQTRHGGRTGSVWRSDVFPPEGEAEEDDHPERQPA